ncbi:polyketide synthase dehydratase-domain-containing protein [Lipomyces starkeyi]|uniref:Carrier domain-containing protein n=1 Tax=Lipomyces starkeyi NRRL Y-11557 TaxID=675824 RepID=A0A1E3QAE9_LIPST|nr:hypothetical protein LIPSTDRAFT_61583 [Lipomyces starkeyi NRRL Y-11557]
MGSIEDTEPRPWDHGIVGMSAKYGGDATTTGKLWRMLVEGWSGWSSFPDSRFRAEGVYHPDSQRPNSTHVKGAHFLSEDVGLFDAAFFGYSGETATSLDPQYRLQLESVYEALEMARPRFPSPLSRSPTGQFCRLQYLGLYGSVCARLSRWPTPRCRQPTAPHRNGNGVPMMANRVSHFFDFRGASVTIETACSSGMVAVHQAVQTLRTREADMSIVGGANLTLNPDMFKALGSAGGYGRGEGVATLVLKRLSDALTAGDPIRAVIRESMVNQDASRHKRDSYVVVIRKQGWTLLKRSISRRMELAPIEAQGIATVFAAREQPLPIGSIKTNIGHTGAASGLASIIKTALAMKKGVIPPSINFEEANSKLKLDKWNLKVVREVEPWPSTRIRRASINNFGYGGTNSHIILEDGASWVKAAFRGDLHPEGTNGHCDAQAARDVSKVLVLSGKDEQACQRMIAGLAAYIEQNLVPHDLGEYIDDLTYTLGQPAADSVSMGSSASDFPVRWWYAMGRELIEAYPVFKDALLEAQGSLEQFGADWSLIDELKRTLPSVLRCKSPSCLGVVPVAVTSHSSGQIAAAYAVGALSYRSAVAFAYYRALLASDKSLRLPVPGGMVAIGLSLEETEAYLSRLKSDDQAVIACVNSPSSITVSGDLSAVTELEEGANAEGLFARRLRVDTAWHSRHMTPQNRVLRARSQPPHDLLGSLVEGTNPHAPTWRHVLRISESPWTRDHAIQSNVVYPAAGYICLAIEAVRQLPALVQQPVGEVQGFQLRDVDFLQALVIPDNSDGIEIQTNLRSTSAKNSSSGEWKEFEIWSLTTDNRWTQHAKGLISVQSKDSSPHCLQFAKTTTDAYTRRILPADLFANLRNLGIQHGPVFQNMTSIVQSGSEQRSIVRMTVPDVSVGNDVPRDHVLHPVTQDSIITSPYSAIHGAAARETAAKVPRAVESLWVSSAIGHSAGHLLSVDSTLLRNNDQGLTADVVVSDGNTGGVVLEMKGFSYQSLGAAMSLNQSKPWMPELCNKVHWSLDISISLPATLDAVRKELMATVANNEGGRINPRPIAAAHDALVRHFSHKNPRARILEIGASQGAVASHALGALGSPESGGPNASLYHFTDSSAASFERTREELLNWADILSFDELDIQRDPATQGFALGTYDIVIASGVEFAVEHTPQALSNIRSLLRPGGALLLGHTKGLSLQSWETQLQTTGFTGVSLAMPHNGEPSDAGPVTILSTACLAPDSTSAVKADKVVIVTSQRTPPPSAWLRKLQDTIIVRTGSDGKSAPAIQELESPTATAASYAGKIYIFLGEADDAILYNLDPTLLEGIHEPGKRIHSDPAHEYIGRKFVTLEIDPKGAAWSETSVAAIGEIVRTTIGNSPDGLEELEYAEGDGVILVPRICHDVARNNVLSSATSVTADDTQVSVQPFHQPFRPLSLQSESLVFADDEIADPWLECLPPASIELEPAVYLAILDETTEHITSPAAAGIITGVGEEAAVQGKQSLPTAFLTAYYALVHTARLERDQSVLIHAAAGDAGQASIMLAQHIGAKVYATAGSPAERGLLILKDAESMLSSTYELRQESLKLVAPLGHFVDINPRNTQSNSHLATSTLNHGGSITTVDIAALLEHRSTDVHHALHELISLLESGAVSSVHPITTLDISHIAEASTVLHNNKIGSVALSADEKSTVPAVPTKAAAKVSSEASYLIVGGSGGLAQSAARWLVGRGAKNLVLVSRSAGTSDGVAALAAELIEAGCRRVLPISCDVANADLDGAIDKCAEASLPPIRGVIHAAFVLRISDALVEKMTLEDWKYTIESKVAGTATSTSSSSSPRSTGCYSAAGAYEDALCHWRVNHCNLPAVSIDLSVVNAVGYVAEAGASESLPYHSSKTAAEPSRKTTS